MVGDWLFTLALTRGPSSSDLNSVPWWGLFIYIKIFKHLNQFPLLKVRKFPIRNRLSGISQNTKTKTGQPEAPGTGPMAALRRWACAFFTDVLPNDVMFLFLFSGP